MKRIARQKGANQPPEKKPKGKRNRTNLEKRNSFVAKPSRRTKKRQPYHLFLRITGRMIRPGKN
jgi:hypothetical protein